MEEKNDKHVTDTLLNSDNSKSNNKKINSPKRSTLKIVILALSILVICLALALLVSFLARNEHCSENESYKSNKTESNNSKHTKKIVISNKLKAIIENNSLDSSKWNQSRLPTSFKPSSYKLDLKIDVIEKEFYGNCSITFKCFESTNQLVLHSEKNIVFQSKSYLPTITEIDNDGNEIRKLEVASVDVNRFYSYIIMELKEKYTFQKDHSYTILFENYYSTISNNLKGLYYSTYTSPTNEVKPIVVSQLQPLDARAVFPSFDEPSMKAIFTISIQHQKSNQTHLIVFICSKF